MLKIDNGWMVGGGVYSTWDLRWICEMWRSFEMTSKRKQ